MAFYPLPELLSVLQVRHRIISQSLFLEFPECLLVQFPWPWVNSFQSIPKKIHNETPLAFKKALANSYDHEYNTVKNKLVADGISPDLAEQATKEMMTQDPIKTTVRQKYGFNVGQYTNPLSAAIASMISFPTGSILPLVAITMFPSSIRIFATFLAVVIALAITGYTAARLGNASPAHGVFRNVVSGVLTMIVTYTIGTLIGS